MTRLHNAADRFAAEMLEGFADAHRDRVRPVPGGVIRADPRPSGSVAVVIGGGSGHYPAFVGMVGPGLADAAAAGDLFASPSAAQIISVTRAVETGGGVLLAFGNYAGDTLNFGQAAQRLRAEGIDARLLPITDDIASAPPRERHRRRGIAGDLVVFKIAGAAAAAGMDLDHVEQLAQRANDRTRSLGIAFAGCTLPGADAPLFELPAATMAVGMGVHGEPGIRTMPMTSADELAAVLIDELLAEAPEGGEQRVAAVLDGLGATKYEELFVLWRAVAARLREHGLRIVRPEVGELITSLDMTGCSLTLTWLDDELEHLWLAPADAPGFRRSATAGCAAAEPLILKETETPDVPRGSDASRAAAGTAVAMLKAICNTLREHESYLGGLDAVAGDGDHGRGMVRGAQAAAAAATALHADGAGLRNTLMHAADAWAEHAGGTSGALWGAGLRAIAERLDDIRPPDTAAIAAGISGALTAIARLGGARVGDKTLLDALAPFSEQLAVALARGATLGAAWAEGAAAATAAAANTAELRARAGRARPLGERSIGSPDPGAVSLALCLTAAGAVLEAAATEDVPS